jgi:histidine phosphotransfer protein HptB
MDSIMTQSMIHSSLISDPDFAELVSEFVGQVPVRVSAIRESIVEQRFSELCTLVHQLRGACGSYGFHELTPLATNLEMDLRSGKSIEELAPQFDAFLNSCLCMTAEPASS